MSYVVGFDPTTFPYLNQKTAKTQDGRPPEDALYQCGAAAACMWLDRYGVSMTNGEPVAPDTFKDYVKGESWTGNLSQYDLVRGLNHWGLDATIIYPSGERNGSTGLLDVEWQYLVKGKGVIGLFCWIDTDGTAYLNIGHWRAIVQQTDRFVTSGDPWVGRARLEDWATHYGYSRQLLVCITTPAP